MKSCHIKTNGIHYTPTELAMFLAQVTVEEMAGSTGWIDILDPACGDGVLLRALASVVPDDVRCRLRLFGYERDEQAIERAVDDLRSVGVAEVVLKAQDFLAVEGTDASTNGQLGLFDRDEVSSRPLFDIVIANPPYVRTQVLGASKAQDLARRFELSGRVDLYQAFVKGMANVLKPGGLLGLLTSNRFLTIRSGASLRKLLQTHFQPLAVYDLGDTKLFSAAVLPAIVVARRQCDRRERTRSCRFDRVYEHRVRVVPEFDAPRCESVLAAVRERDLVGLVHASTGTYLIERGALSSVGTDGVWSLSTPDSQEWLKAVARKREHVFAEVAHIRVGIKTTADEVFLRDEWTSLPAECQPEPALIRPLIRHFDARRWTGPDRYRQQVLYPHTIVAGKRFPVDLQEFPKARRYLESHFERLNRRRYVIEGGRQWYEIWVPHSPADWHRDKIVFPDIAETPTFFLDTTGAVVNGDCYWMTVREGRPAEWLRLMLAVANSSFITRFYDAAFHNKLYAGRRRFMTQYVGEFPLPALECSAAQEILRLLPRHLPPEGISPSIEAQLDVLVWESFGLVKEG